MQRVRQHPIRFLSYPVALLLPFLLVSVSTGDSPSRAIKTSAALSATYQEPSDGIERALAAQRRRIIDEAAVLAASDEKVAQQVKADAETAAAIEATKTQEAAEAQAAAEAEEAAAAARAAAAKKAAAAKAAAVKVEVAAKAPATAVQPNPSPRTGTGSMPPEYVKQCESGGNYQAVNPNGHYGAWQFSQATWNGVGGTGRPDHASPAEQDYRASILWNNGAGAGNWACY